MITLKGVFPDTKPSKSKNFILENVKNVRRISSRSGKEENAKSGEEKTAVGQKKTRRNASANVLFSKSSASQKSNGKNGLDLVKTSSDPNIRFNKKRNSSGVRRSKVTYKDRGIQTSFKTDFAEGDSGSIPNSTRENKEQHSLNEENIRKLEIETVQKLSINNDEHIKKNSKENTFHKPDKDLDTTGLPHSCRSESGTEDADHSQMKANRSTSQTRNKNVGVKHRMGVVPKYLKDRKEILLKEKQEKEAEAAQPACPEGHILLPDHERKETLSMLKKSYQDCINELNRLPIRSDTLRAHQKKMELEKKLNKLEDGIKVFSRPKVFVKVNS